MQRPGNPVRDFALLDAGSAMERIWSAVRAREPFSLVRLGDGEGVALTFGEDSWLSDAAYLRSHWGGERVPIEAVATVRRDLITAVENADLVGLRDDVVGASVSDDLCDLSGPELRRAVLASFPIRDSEVDSLSEAGARRIALLHRALSLIDWTPGQQFCSQWIHWDLLASGVLGEILEEVSEVGLVTSRPEVEPRIAHRYSVKVTTVLVPEEFQRSARAGAHVPDRYPTMRGDLKFAEGTLVLVGAGIPGKAYCDWLKKAGCVAIDIGAVFDAWVGQATRPRVLEDRFGVRSGGSVPQSLQLAPVRTPVDRGLIPRWKSTGRRASPGPDGEAS